MEQVRKWNGGAEKNSPLAQPKLISKQQTGEFANSLGNSPLMVAQRKKLHSLFGNAMQMQSVEGEISQGRPETAQAVSGPIQRVQAQRDGDFDSAAAKPNAAGAALPAMAAPAYGGTAANNTGQNASRTGIHLPAYGSGVGGFRPTHWQTLENLTGGNPWKQLHLLNDNLGGQGQNTNLAPGSTSFNAQHLHGAERPVKTWTGANGGVGAGHAADYNVTAHYGNPASVITHLHNMYDGTHNAATMIANVSGHLYNNAINHHYANTPFFTALMDAENQAQQNDQTAQLLYQIQIQWRQNTYWNQIMAGVHPLLAQWNLGPPPVAPVPHAIDPNLANALNVLRAQAYNQATLQVNQQIAQDKAWLTNYANASFPVRFQCRARFYEENPVGTVNVSNWQEVNITYA